MPVVLIEIGSKIIQEGVAFCVWAPFAEDVEVEIISPQKKIFPMQKDKWGYWKVTMDEPGENILYNYLLNKKLSRPDPASRHQPQGVHGSSRVIKNIFKWTDNDWKPIAVGEMIIYELHTGIFTSEGTFESIKDKIPYFKDLGINTIELMPVAQFPGERNWGYDGVYPFAVQNSYGGPEKLKELVNACHNQEIAVIMDVVYNHLGPEGNYLNDYGPYFTDKYSTPWGKALNFDDAYSDHIRNYFIQNAIMWFREYHIDALRLDAVHAIFDASANPFLKELSEITKNVSREDGKEYQLIAESDLNDIKIVNDFEKGGYNHDAQWMDDFHHCVHTLLTGETKGYYSDFGTMEQLVKCINAGFVYDGIYSPHRNKTYGNSSREIPKSKFVVCIQNHDQVGNRAKGDRLSTFVSFEKLKLAAACMILSPFVPMLFMGEEYGEDNPFLYFISHTDKDLIKAVQEGRAKEFSSFEWKEEIPDPQSVETYKKCILNFNLLNNEKNKKHFLFYKTLIELKKDHPLLKVTDQVQLNAENKDDLLIVRRKNKKQSLNCYFNFSDESIKLKFADNEVIILNSGDKKWAGDNEKEQIEIHLMISPQTVIITEAQNE